MTIAAAIEQTPAERIQSVIAELGLAMTAEFVPFSKSRNAKPGKDGKVWRSLNWRVTLTKRQLARHDDQGQDYKHTPILTTDYSQGEAHCPAYKASVKVLGGRNCIMRDEAIAAECETGKTHVARDHAGVGVGYQLITQHKIADPSIVDVVCSLVSESDALDHGSFEEWASNLGYDEDSRSDEKIYRACLEIALKLRNGIGEAGLAKLQEACQDY